MVALFRLSERPRSASGGSLPSACRGQSGWPLLTPSSHRRLPIPDGHYRSDDR